MVYICILRVGTIRSPCCSRLKGLRTPLFKFWGHPLRKKSRALAVTKSEAWGSNGNFVHDINEKPLRLRSVTVRTSDLFDGIKFTYIDQTGQTRTENLWGFSQDGSEHTVTLGPSEFLKEVSGVIDNSNEPNYFVRSIKLVTNQREFGPFGGAQGGTEFKSRVPEDSMIVAFHGSSGDNWPGHYRMHSIGVYSIPRNVLTT
ncbi:protein GOS9-like isoform X2 [Hordeum vulgare subsp. vulgare]|uniref:protein GOS9-like isoform X2 n=1 Tax=Hordeum vulgare subsp. vulgare TaxID=112509 RepID=UPI001D1A5AA7|nr:protein GOS9-like isoform X2 [Hordeum vulgare subsp. vulgare]